MKIIIGVLMIVAILLIGCTIYIVLGDEGVIPPYDGDETPDPDSGDGDEPEDVSVEIKFTTPNSQYDVPQSGCSKGGFYSIYVEGQVYGTNTNDINAVRLTWVGVDYGLMSYSPDSDNFDRYDDYNIYWYADITIQQLGAGSHLLKAEALQGNTVIAEASINIVIPSSWVYHWDSRNPIREDAVWRGWDGGLYFYGFQFPYENNDPVNNWCYLTGEITRVTGQVHSVLNDCAVNIMWLDVWNGVTGEWVVSIYDRSVPYHCNGWSSDLDISVNNVWGNEIGFAGTTNDVIDGFVGDVYIIPGTASYQQSPLSILMSMFSSDSQFNPPHK